ncbi:MAG: winged helix-turn-helix domain-containing protein [Phycisphaerales bacterium]
MRNTHAERISRTTKALRASLLIVLQHVDELSRLAEEMGNTPAETPPDSLVEPICRVDRRTLTVHWRERECFLGYTMPFRLMERLAQRSNQYITADRLMEDLWGGAKAPSTIRSAVSDLRAKLVGAGMAELAAMIDGSNPGHYGLIKTRTLPEADALPTAVRRQSDSYRRVHG